jgi:hypothetical protein
MLFEGFTRFQNGVVDEGFCRETDPTYPYPQDPSLADFA